MKHIDLKLITIKKYPPSDGGGLFALTFLSYVELSFGNENDENAQRYSGDDRRKRIQKYALSNENASVWTGPHPDNLLTHPRSGSRTIPTGSSMLDESRTRVWLPSKSDTDIVP